MGTKADTTSEKKLEDLFAELEDLLKVLEDRDTSLEDSFAAYQKGVGLIKECNDKIDRVEKEILILSGGEE